MKKGFTLVELLAVILILSTISLIVVPITTSQIKKSVVSAYRTSVQNVIEKAKEYTSKNMSNGDIPEDGLSVKSLNLKNDSIKSGIIKRNETGEIDAINIFECAKGIA